MATYFYKINIVCAQLALKYKHDFILGFSAQKLKADAYHKVMRKNYQELLTVLPINGMMNDLVGEGVITRKMQLTLDAKQSRQGRNKSYDKI